MIENSFNRPLPNIEYIAYVNDKAIARDEWGELYYQELPRELFTPGEVAYLAELDLVSDLPEDEQEKIREFLEME